MKRFNKIFLITFSLTTIFYIVALLYIQVGYTLYLNFLPTKLTIGSKPENVIKVETYLNSSTQELYIKYSDFSYKFNAKVLDYDVNNKKICGAYSYRHIGYIGDNDLETHKRMLADMYKTIREISENIKNSSDWDIWIINNYVQELNRAKNSCSEFVYMNDSKKNLKSDLVSPHIQSLI